jgi:hypothetical protein
MSGHLKFAYEALKQTAPNQITLNLTIRSQTYACITKSSCEMHALLGYYTAQSGNSLPAFWDALSVPPSKIKICKRENRAQLTSNDTFFWLGGGLCPLSNSLKKHDISEASCFRFQAKEQITGVPLHCTTLSHCTP